MTQAGFRSEKEIATLKKDLRTFLTGWQKQPRLYMKETLALTNPNVMEGGAVNQDAFALWGKEAFPVVLDDMTSKRKKRIDGEDWSVGSMGSIWKDMELCGVPTRLCYYSRKHNGEQFPGLPEGKNHVLMLDPHSITDFQRDSDDEDDGSAVLFPGEDEVISVMTGDDVRVHLTDDDDFVEDVNGYKVSFSKIQAIATMNNMSVEDVKYIVTQSDCNYDAM